jgi:hypothetical protein
MHSLYPAVQATPIATLLAETGLSRRYLQRIRRGELVPAPRHWPAFRDATSKTAGKASE